MPATIFSLFLNKASRAPLERVERVEALEDRGFDGDRHARPGSRRSILLMAVEDLETFGLAPGDVREQMTVRGLDLYGPPNGTRLHAGSAVLELRGTCAPCARMEELKPGLQVAIDGRRGRFAHVVSGGTLAAGDTLFLEPPP